MSSMYTARKISSLSQLSIDSRTGREVPFLLDVIQHFYIKLDFQHQYENAKTAEDANGFLRSVARAAMAASHVAERYGGFLLEVQGSMLHIGIPANHGQLNSIRKESSKECVGDLHVALTELFGQARSRIDGWRMTVDGGKTLVVSGRGVHGDNSWVSLGRSANRPAKHLYSQLELPEDSRGLKRFYVGYFEENTGKWRHEPLNLQPSTLNEMRAIAKKIRASEPRVIYSGLITASAAPIPSSGHPAAPSADRPHTYFGWVMRTDLDGFTARVEACLDSDQKLGELAVVFYRLMDAAADFVQYHQEELAQLPWAGDNFTAAAVFSSKANYESAIPKQLVELTLDFEKEMTAIATECGFGGWAHSVAGGQVHGNAYGNIYIAGIEVGSRRFLVGAGEGVGRSTQGFGDIDPDAGEVVVYKDDWDLLANQYKEDFGTATTKRNQVSSLFRVAQARKLLSTRAQKAAGEVAVKATFGSNQLESVVVRPFSNE